MDANIDGVTNLQAFDSEERMTPIRRRALTTIAFGEFVDAFDLIMIGSVLLQLKPHFHLTASQAGLVTSVAYLGSIVGALFFGDVADRIGRRQVFVLNLVAFVGLALLSAFITQIWMLIVLRTLMGVAIGADIVASMAFLAELSPRNSRGSWTGALPQITWSLGALTAILLYTGLYFVAGTNAWRIMFAAGAIPAFVVLLLRSSLPDSPRWLLSHGRIDDAVAAFEKFGLVVHDRSQLSEVANRPQARPERQESSFRRGIQPYIAIFRKPYLGPALFAVLITGLTPLAGIGQAVMGPYIFKEVVHLDVTGSLLSGSVVWFGALVGTIIAWKTIDRIGRTASIAITLASYIPIYVLMLTVAHGNLGLVPLLFLIGVIAWFGSAAWWPLPSELLPTATRARAQGLGSALQRLTSGVNTYLVPVLLVAAGFTGTVLTSGAIAVVLLGYTLWGRRFEPAAKSLDESSHDELFTHGFGDATSKPAKHGSAQSGPAPAQ